jgi:hypothetical protein
MHQGKFQGNKGTSMDQLLLLLLLHCTALHGTVRYGKEL